MTVRYISVFNDIVIGVITLEQYDEVDESVKFKWTPTDRTDIRFGWLRKGNDFVAPVIDETTGEAASDDYFTKVDKNIFYMLFTPQEEAAIRTIAKTNPLIDVLVNRLDKAENVNLTLPTVQQSLQLLQTTPGTLLTAQRVAHIKERKFPTNDELMASEVARLQWLEDHPPEE
jgi:hypothetical protein